MNNKFYIISLLFMVLGIALPSWLLIRFYYFIPKEGTKTFSTDSKLNIKFDLPKVWIEITPANLLVFYNGDKKLGEIDFSSDSVKFRGNVDKSARIFFEVFWRDYLGNSCLKDEKNEEKD